MAFATIKAGNGNSVPQLEPVERAYRSMTSIRVLDFRAWRGAQGEYLRMIYTRVRGASHADRRCRIEVHDDLAASFQSYARAAWMDPATGEWHIVATIPEEQMSVTRAAHASSTGRLGTDATWIHMGLDLREAFDLLALIEVGR